MVGFLFWTQLGRLSILNLDSMVGFLLYSELGQHGRLSTLF